MVVSDESLFKRLGLGAFSFGVDALKFNFRNIAFSLQLNTRLVEKLKIT